MSEHAPHNKQIVTQGVWTIGPAAHLNDFCPRRDRSPSAQPGFLYAIEFETAVVKVGRSLNPVQRIAGQLRAFGAPVAIRVAISKAHWNSEATEKAWKRALGKPADRHEYFSASLDAALDVGARLPFDFDSAGKMTEGRVDVGGVINSVLRMLHDEFSIRHDVQPLPDDAPRVTCKSLVADVEKMVSDVAARKVLEILLSDDGFQLLAIKFIQINGYYLDPDQIRKIAIGKLPMPDRFKSKVAA